MKQILASTRVYGLFVLFVIACSCAVSADDNAKTDDGFSFLFDGQVATDWDGDLRVFRIQDKSIVGGQLESRIPHNFFLSHKKDFGNFELRLQFKLLGEKTNAGIQIRSQRIADHHEMIGYQADLGAGYWGALYDESRRRKVLAKPDMQQLVSKVLKKDTWNDYRIVCKGPRIQLWINETQTVDYTEKDESIPLTGKIALQIHGGPAGEAWYRNIRIKPLK